MRALLLLIVLAACAPAPASTVENGYDARSSATIVAAGDAFDCTPTRVWDGDGPIWCAEGPHVRLDGVNARELDGSCRPGHPCVDAGGIEARDAAVSLLGGPRGVAREGHVLVDGPLMSCRSDGSALGDRTAASCMLPDGRDLACALLDAGMVARWELYWGDKTCPRAIAATS